MSGRSRVGGVALALTAGSVAAFGFAPTAWPLALLAGLALWFLSLRTCTAAQAAWRGLSFGLGYFGWSVYWLYYTGHVYGLMPLPFAVAATAALIVLLALYPALAAYLGGRFFGTGLSRLLAVACLFAVLEGVRGVAFSGFPWVPVGQAALDGVYAGYLPVLGVRGTGLLLLLTAALAASTLRCSPHALLERASLIGLMLIGGVTLQALEWTTPTEHTQPIALVQAGIAQEDRWNDEFFPLTLARHRQLTEEAYGTPLVIWPEAAIPTLYRATQPFYRDIRERSLKPGAILIAGTFVIDEESGLPANALRNMTTGAEYRKRRLVPFGEQMPLRGPLDFLYARLRVPMQDLVPGTTPPRFDIYGEKVLLSICFETIFQDLTQASETTTGWFLNVSNDGWFGDSRGPWQHLGAARARAAESGREMARAATTGITAIIDAKGQVRTALPQHEAGVLIDAIQPYRGATPYMQWADYPALLLLTLLLIGCRWQSRRSSDHVFRT